MTSKLPDDATVAEVLPTLRNPEDYLRGMLENMMLCKREHGGASVRIGTTGLGITPHYRVEPDKDYLDVVLKDGGDISPYFVAYHGSNHKRLDWGFDELQTSNWSAKLMTLNEIQVLLGNLRGFRRKRP